MKNYIIQFVSATAGAAVLLGTVGVAQAATITTTIDFESGFSDRDFVDTILAGGKEVTFSVGSGTTGGINPAFIVEVGEPVTGFDPRDGEMTAIEEDIGNFFLKALGRLNYFIEFDQPVSSFGVDILDFRGEGDTIGDLVTLTVFSDGFLTPIDSATFTIVPGLPDPNLETLFVDVPGNLIQSASIVHSGIDGGSGIDNITFEMEMIGVSEPSSMLGLLALGSLGASSTVLSRKKQQ